MKEIKTHVFNGQKYLITLGGCDGICVTPSKRECELVIMADLGTKEGLTTAIHEALHACNWSTSEEKVEKTSKDIGRFLWRLGYRC